MNHYKPKFLLSTKNNKTVKGEKYGWITYIMYLSPFNQNATGKNVCSHASQGCAEACLFGSGFGGMFTDVEKGRINKTNYFLAERQEFLNQLKTEIEKLVKKHAKKKENVCIRLNGTSDLAFEKFKVEDNKSIIELFPNVQFYDYTKNHFRFNRILPENYHLTFSRSETNDIEAENLLAQGHNVAIVFDKLPETYKGYKVINGDLSDLRFKDEENVVIGLKYKNLTGKGADNKKAFESGFALKIENLEEDKVVKAA
jgi:hypothetical protein